MHTERVSFYSGGYRLEGVLHTPSHAPKPFPVIVQGPGWMEQVCSKVSEPFHEGFVQAGYAVLHFNSRGFGGSEGEPGWVRPLDQVEDLLNAITYVETREDLDPRRLGLFGLGGTGGGNAIYAAAYDPRPKCVVVQTVVADGAQWLREMRREYEWIEFLRRVESNRRRRVTTNEDELVDPTEELMVATPERRAKGMPTYGKSFHLGSAEHLLRYRPLDVVYRISPRGLLLVCIEDDVVTPEHHAVALFERAGPPKRLVRQRGVTHYDAYTRHYDLLMREFVGWFQRFLVSAPVTTVEVAEHSQVVHVPADPSRV